MSQSWFRRNWGAEPAAGGRWRFRIWAPSTDDLAVEIDGERHIMDRVAGGWFVADVKAAPGKAYTFALPDGTAVPDPAARAQADDVHGPSVLVDPRTFDWQADWNGRPFEDVVLYELHTGTFSPEGDFDGVRTRLDHIAEAGFTAVELCPVAHFAGRRGWGYDGVLPYAAHTAYGGPDGLKRLIDAAHRRGLMVFLDVVYNHFGPDGNYLHAYAPDFFNTERKTPWGAAIAFDCDPVRSFFVDNALYWLDEYRFDGLRLDAVDQIRDPSPEHLLSEIARRVRSHDFGRPVHLTTEDERNITAYHERDADGRTVGYDGEWNDDFHHVAHVLATGENDGYYADYAVDPRSDMATALSEGFVQQGRPSPFRDGERRGQPSAHLPPSAFVNFLQNHDQAGNRAFWERLTTLAPSEAIETLTALLLLSPTTPLFFMGEEWGETRPFQFFCDFEGELADAVREGRRREFAKWPAFADPALREKIPDPNDPETFERSCLDWDKTDADAGKARLALFRELNAIRAREIAPRLPGMRSMQARAEAVGERGLRVAWTLGDGATLTMRANLGGAPLDLDPDSKGQSLFAYGELRSDAWAIAVDIEEAAA